MRPTVILAALCAVALASSADARPRDHRRHSVVSRIEIPPSLHRVMATGAGRIVGGRPSGCPRRYYGCGAAVHCFGRPIRSLWLARNWLFPRAEPATGRAAVRRDGHHIVILRRHVRGHIWSVYDANSGRHRTRVHPRSIAGWTIVDPGAGT